LTKSKLNIYIKLPELCNDYLIYKSFLERKKEYNQLYTKFVSSVHYLMFVTKVKLYHIL
jgi:hypothetical protein